MAFFTDRELDVMSVLWRRGASTAAEVRAALGEPLAYTTVLTMLRILEEKGFVSHEAEGRVHRFTPLVERGEAQRSALVRIIDRLFQGSAAQLIAHLVTDERLTSDELRRLAALLDVRVAEEKTE